MRRSSEETKAVILAAARERFAADGHDRATIRAVASDPNIDPAMVMRYLGNKERLLAGCTLPAAGSDPEIAAVLYTVGSAYRVNSAHARRDPRSQAIIRVVRRLFGLTR